MSVPQPPPVPPASPSVPTAGAAGWLAAVDALVFASYRTGFLHSLVLHVAVLLVLALIVIRADSARPLPIALEFAATAGEPEPDLVVPDVPALAPAELPLPDPVAPLADVAEPEPEIAVELAAVEPVSFAAFEADAADAALLVDVPPPAAGRDGAAAGRIGGEIGRRLAAAGAGTGDVQVSIAWNNVNDIDLHVLVEPLDPGLETSLINFTNRVGIAGGCLDVDRNVHPETRKPVENVFWAKGMAPYGRFTVGLHHYRSWGGGDPTEVEVVVLADGRQERFRVALRSGDPVRVVTSFRRVPQPGTPLADGSVSFPPVPRPAWRPAAVAGGGRGGRRPASAPLPPTTPR